MFIIGTIQSHMCRISIEISGLADCCIKVKGCFEWTSAIMIVEV